MNLVSALKDNEQAISHSCPGVSVMCPPFSLLLDSALSYFDCSVVDECDSQWLFACLRLKSARVPPVAATSLFHLHWSLPASPHLTDYHRIATLHPTWQSAAVHSLRLFHSQQPCNLAALSGRSPKSNLDPCFP